MKKESRRPATITLLGYEPTVQTPTPAIPADLDNDWRRPVFKKRRPGQIAGPVRPTQPYVEFAREHDLVVGDFCYSMGELGMPGTGKLVKWRRHHGLCIQCGRDAQGYWLCKRCRSRQRKARDWRRQHHYCIHCGRPAPDGAQCKRCRQRNRLEGRLRRARTPEEKAIVLLLLAGYSCAAIGRQLGVSRQAVHDFVSRRRRARKLGPVTAKLAAQRRRVERLLAQGRCTSCGAPLGKYKSRCDACAERSRRRRRRQYREQREAAGFRVQRRRRYPRSP